MPDNPPEQRTATVEVEDVRTEGRNLQGFACLYGAESRDLGGFTETIEPGAFSDVLAGDPDVLLTFNHSPDKVLARTGAGTLKLRDEERGLAFEAELGDGPTAQDVRDMVRRGDLSGASFRFVVAPDGESWEGEKRTLTKVAELIDVSLATTPAYDGPRVELRTHNNPAPTEKDTSMDTEKEKTEGGLAVEDRAATTEERSIEQRIEDGLRSVRKGESRALTTSANVSPGELSVTLFDKLRAGSVVLNTGIPTISTDADSVTYPTLTADVSPSWTAEAAAITPGDPTFGTLTATPRKLAHLVQFSNEVIDDSDPSIATVLNSHLMTMLALKLDAGLLEGSGTAPEIRGIKNIASIQTLAAATNGQAPTLDNIADAIALLEGVNVPHERIRIIVHPRNIATLRKLKASTAGTYLWDADPSAAAPSSIFGVPVYTSSQLSTTETQGTSGAVANSAYVYDVQSLVYVQRTPIEIELDRSRLFNSDQSEMRAKLRGDLISPTPTGIVRVTGFLA